MPTATPRTPRAFSWSATTAIASSLLLCAACPPAPPQPTFFGPGAQGAPPSGAPTDPATAPGDVATDPWAGTPAPVGATPAPAAPSQASSDLTFAVPSGFAQRGDWYVSAQQEQRYGYVATTAGVVRTNLPAMAPQGDNGAALRAAWDAYMPVEAKGTASGMVFRRYVGDGLTAYYLHGSYELEPQHKAGWWSLYLVDCGQSWQPVVAGGLYEQTDDSAGFEMTSKFAVASGLATTEPFLAGLRCSGPRGQPIIAPNLLVGRYHYGSGAYQEYVNIYTGAGSAQYISYGGQYDLRADGSVSYQHSSAGDTGGGTQFAGEKDEGTWQVQQDLILFSFRRLGARSFRIASVTDFTDARSVVFLDTRTAATPQEIRSGTFLTTKPAK